MAAIEDESVEFSPKKLELQTFRCALDLVQLMSSVDQYHAVLATSWNSNFPNYVATL